LGLSIRVAERNGIPTGVRVCVDVCHYCVPAFLRPGYGKIIPPQ
jgi:hypothetical protein